MTVMLAKLFRPTGLEAYRATVVVLSILGQNRRREGSSDWVRKVGGPASWVLGHGTKGAEVGSHGIHPGMRPNRLNR